jgi:hypothetical protein
MSFCLVDQGIRLLIPRAALKPQLRGSHSDEREFSRLRLMPSPGLKVCCLQRTRSASMSSGLKSDPRRKIALAIAVERRTDAIFLDLRNRMRVFSWPERVLPCKSAWQNAEAGNRMLNEPDAPFAVPACRRHLDCTAQAAASRLAPPRCRSVICTSRSAGSL